MMKVPPSRKDRHALNLLNQEAVLAELDAIESRRVAGALTDAEAEVAHDAVLHRIEERSEAYRAQYAAWFKLEEVWERAKLAALYLMLVAAPLFALLGVFHLLRA